MIEYTVLDMNTYRRKAHLDYFMSMQHPQVNVTADIDVTDLIELCKKKKYSFFLSFLHIVALSADEIPEFRQRIHRLSGDDFEVREYIQSPTSNTEPTRDDMYCYSTLFHHMPWDEYIVTATKRQQAAREKGSLEEDEEIEAFYFPTCVPWLHYRDVVHPMTDRYDSNPRFSWGKYEPDYRGRMMMPFTVAVHHGLVDGKHIAKLYENIEKNMKALIQGQL